MDSSEQVYSEIKLAESQIHQINSSFLALQFQFSQQWRTLQNSLGKIQSSLRNRYKELESKEENLNSIQKSIENRQKEVELKEKQFNFTGNFVCDRCKTLGVKVSETGNVVVKIEPSIEFRGEFSTEDASIKLFVTMDGKTLQLFLNDRVDEHEFMGEEVKSAIKLSSDPAKLVLDAMKGFFPPHLKKGKVEYDGIVVRSSCVLLLEQLMELKPEIKKAVREEARALARVWRKKMRAESGSYKVFLGFLLLVDVYWLWWDFDKDDLGSLCEVVRQHRVVDELDSRLGILQKFHVSNRASQAQKKETCTPPVKNAFVSPSMDSSVDLSALCKEMDGKILQMFLNDRIDEQNCMGAEVQSALQLSSDPAKLVLDAMEGFFRPHLKKDGMEYEEIVVRSSCVLLLEQLMELMPEIKKAVREEARLLACVWREKMRAESGNYMVVMGFLLLVAVYWLWWDFDKEDLRNLCEVVGQHRVVGELHSRLGFQQKYGVSNVASPQKNEPYTPHMKNAFVSPSTDPSIELCTLCKGMDANGLKSYLVKHVKDLKLFPEKVLDCLQWASDPAKLVLNVVQDFYLEIDEFQGDTNVSCCNVLLEQLMQLSPHINFVLKEDIINFAACWKARLAKESTKCFFVFGFLKFLAAYKLSSSFQADEILALFTTFFDKDDIYEFEQIPSLCRALSLEAKIPDLIRSLIKENKWLEAVRFICAFNLADKFPPDPLLKAYLDYTYEAALKTCQNSNNSVKTQNKCAKKQIRALQSVIRCIFDFKLDSEYSPIDLQQRIRQLELQKEERNSLNLEKEKVENKKKFSATASSHVDSKGMKKRAACSTTAQTQLLQGCNLEKRLRSDTVQNSIFPNVSIPMASSMNTLHPPSPEFSQFGLHDTT
ncbi:FRIGIDA-like protein 5 [Chenopodium quinoa]|uniref:FRIGIDA-like protein n=1 Tax=Chenopodium quinoa TaxID=63459 RepID=A0A803KTE8_CHEQI|nr:FRIGIDA-like protein 5 [Chenopodium quinoa]